MRDNSLKWVKLSDDAYVIDTESFALDVVRIEGTWVLRIFFKYSGDLCEWITRDLIQTESANTALVCAVGEIRNIFGELFVDMWDISHQVES